MKRQWLLLPLALTAGALVLSAATLGGTWATAQTPPAAAGTEEPVQVPHIVRQNFEEDQKKALEKARAERKAQEQKDIATIHERRKALEKAQAEASPAPPSTGTPPLAAVPAVASALPKQGLISELVAILNETKSIDTFIVTLRLLERTGPQAEPAIPAILRNAERLELFKDHFTRKEVNGEVLDDILAILEKIQRKEEKSHGKDPLLARPKDARPTLPPDPPMSAEKN